MQITKTNFFVKRVFLSVFIGVREDCIFGEQQNNKAILYYFAFSIAQLAVASLLPTLLRFPRSLLSFVILKKFNQPVIPQKEKAQTNI